MTKFIFDLQRFEAIALTQDSFTSATATSTGLKTGKITVDGQEVEVYLLESGDYTIGDGATAVDILLDKPVVVASGATVNLTMNGKGSASAVTISDKTDATGFKKIKSLIAVQTGGVLNITGGNPTYNSVKTTNIDSAVEIIAETTLPDENTTQTLTTEKLTLTGKTYGIKNETDANVQIATTTTRTNINGGSYGIWHKGNGTLTVNAAAINSNLATAIAGANATNAVGIYQNGGKAVVENVVINDKSKVGLAGIQSISGDLSLGVGGKTPTIYGTTSIEFNSGTLTATKGNINATR